MNHLLDTLRGKYTISVDWKTSLYIGIILDWDYQERKVTLSMPQYVQKALNKFKHDMPTSPEYAPHEHITPVYGAKVQYATQMDDSEKID